MTRIPRRSNDGSILSAASLSVGARRGNLNAPLADVRNERHPSGRSSSNSKTGFHVRRADPEDPADRDGIIRLWLGNLPQITPAAAARRFAWLYRENPAGPAVTWLAVDDEDGRAVGCASIIPRRFVIEGNLLQGGLAIDFAVEERYRAYGAALRLQRTISERVWEQGFELLFAFPNTASRGVFRRVGYKAVGQPWCGARLIRSFDKLRQRLPILPLATVFSKCVDVALLAQNRIALSRTGGGLRTIVTEEPDDRWQRFWEEKRSTVQFGVSQDLDYLQWYQRQPGVVRRFFGIQDGAGELLGYLVYTRRKEVLAVQDIQVLSERELGPLMEHFWREMHHAGASVFNIGLVGNEAAIRMFRGGGFVTRPSGGWAGILPGPNIDSDVLQALRRADRGWYLADADLDL